LSPTSGGVPSQYVVSDVDAEVNQGATVASADGTAQKPKHGLQDEEDAFELSRQWGVLPPSCRCVGDNAHLAYLDRLRATARRLVNQYRVAVEKLAEELLRTRNLDGTPVEEFTKPWLGKCK
jgi:hypothetical protein